MSPTDCTVTAAEAWVVTPAMAVSPDQSAYNTHTCVAADLRRAPLETYLKVASHSRKPIKKCCFVCLERQQVKPDYDTLVITF